MCGSGLPGHAAENDLDLLPPSLCIGKQRPRGAANPKCVVTKGNVAAALTLFWSLGKRLLPSRRGRCLFCFHFFLKPEPN